MTIVDALEQVLNYPIKEIKRIRLYRTREPESLMYINADSFGDVFIFLDDSQVHLTIDEITSKDWEVKLVKE